MVGHEEIQKIDSLLKKYFVIKKGGGKFPYRIDADGKVWIQDSCQVKPNIKFDRLPLSFSRARAFNVGDCDLTTLEGSPQSCQTFGCSGNQLASLVGSPQDALLVNCEMNQLNSFVGLSPVAEKVIALDNPLTSLDGIINTNISLYISYNSTLPLLRSLKFRMITIMFKGTIHPATAIIDKYSNSFSAPPRSDILACQRELIANGFEGNARW